MKRTSEFVSSKMNEESLQYERIVGGKVKKRGKIETEIRPDRQRQL